MKNQKLKLDALKVQSFVTSMNTNEKQTIDGGDVTFICSGQLQCGENSVYCSNLGVCLPVPAYNPNGATAINKIGCMQIVW